MAFQEKNLSVIGGESSEGPAIYSYNAEGDDVSVDFYFDSKYDTFNVDDIIWVSDTDSLAIFRVTASGPESTDGVDVSPYVSSSTGSGTSYSGGGTVTNTGSSGGYSVEQVTPGADYTLVNINDANEVWVFMDGGDTVTIPNDSTIATGSTYVVFNISTSTEVTCDIEAGATVANVTDGNAFLGQSFGDSGYNATTFRKTGASTWVATDNIAGIP